MSFQSLHSADEDHRSSAVVLDRSRTVALEKVDKAPFSLFHVKVWLVAGAGFFTDAYDIFTISIVTAMIGYIYGQNNNLQPGVDFGLKVASPIGNLVGQILFGWLADLVGRKRMYGVELMIIITSTFAQAIAGSGPAINIVAVLTCLRFIMGIGIGGDYPLSAVITSEFAATRSRGRLMTAVFASQGWGYLASTIVALVTVSGFKTGILQDTPTDLEHLDYCWRILIGAGCVPGVVALYFRLTIPETPRFTMDIERNVKQACRNIEAVLSANGVAPGVWRVDREASTERTDAPRASIRDFRRYFGQWKNARVLFGTAYSWFALDIAFYGLGLNSSKIFTAKILSALGLGSTDYSGTRGIYYTLHDNIICTMIIVSTALLPGYLASFLVIDCWGRRPLQFMGFIMLSILFLIMGFQFQEFNQSIWRLKILMFLYCCANFFQNFGPNVTTFVIPGEVFPTRYRATGHGLSAACGKLGAIVAQIIFYLQGNSIQAILKIFGFVMLSGALSTLLLPETRGRSLEELSNEHQKGFIRGANQIELRNGIVLRKLPQ
ncbi:major facilitator superfamily domain-containing protein [Russula ochroleuca]|jgi:PHS family inorganic phosphate transporter-like MFS transporter|uniref:Major facilitator superfamily domain-containing protein n=1 Tax=Russula ochroleuca TaxID=152965 RepID=A0A9P5TDR1_9AGAM|nr:major facilitator superfamily domain-containing protein [Russula ochroleuca]